MSDPRHRPAVAFLTAIPIAMLGGLIGLGGAEYRLPVLAGPLGYSARRAVPLNLVISLVTIVTAFATRGRSLSLSPIAPLTVPILAMIAGAMVTAFAGPAMALKISNEQLERVILAFLLSIGSALIVESFLPQAVPALVPDALPWRCAVGFVAGLCIGLVSSLLGVAGGELIIPTLIFAFGADIKVAGSASLLISLPTILVGVFRYWSQGAFTERRDLTLTVAPMAIGSIIGAVIGGLLVGAISAAILKGGLGAILIISAIKIFSHNELKSMLDRRSKNKF
jgi:uncharacterized protein